MEGYRKGGLSPAEQRGRQLCSSSHAKLDALEEMQQHCVGGIGKRPCLLLLCTGHKNLSGKALDKIILIGILLRVVALSS